MIRMATSICAFVMAASIIVTSTSSSREEIIGCPGEPAADDLGEKRRADVSNVFATAHHLGNHLFVAPRPGRHRRGRRA